MPIKFRCVYCNQLLGISRRKAGTIVRCTTCEGQLIVPDLNDNDAATTEPAGTNEHGVRRGPPATEAAGAGGGIFEQSDFDAVLEPLGAAKPPAAIASPPAPPPSSVKSKRSGSSPAIPSVGKSGAKSGPVITLTRPALTIVSALLVLALGVAFAGGLLLGLWLR